MTSFFRFFIACSLIALVGCHRGNQRGNNDAVTGDSGALRVGLVLDKGGRDDKSFNTAAVVGAERAAKEIPGVEVKEVESPDDAAYEPAMRTFAERGYGLIIVIGFSQADALKKVVPQFPKTHFAIVDAKVEAPNVAALMFNEHEGSFLVGVAAGLKTKTNVVGFIGGMDIDLIRRFEVGYKEGVAYANPKARALVNYAGVTSDAWANPNKGKELALAQYGQKADVIFAAAGATNMGVFDAAEAKKLYAIGVDSNQNWVKPGLILTSMLKRVDTAVYNTIKSEKEGQFKPGLVTFGLANKGVDYAVDENNKSVLTPEMISKIEKAKADIIAGKIRVSDYYITKKK